MEVSDIIRHAELSDEASAEQLKKLIAAGAANCRWCGAVHDQGRKICPVSGKEVRRLFDEEG